MAPLASLILAFLTIVLMESIQAFVPAASRRHNDYTIITSSHHEKTVSLMTIQDDDEGVILSRRSWIAQIGGASAAIVAATVTMTTLPANALVYVDPDRYGDKELQVGLVNKVRQLVRNAILQDSTLAPLFCQVAIQDALTYSAETQVGGPNGRIVPFLLEHSKSFPSLAHAAQVLVEIRAKLRQSTEMTMADVVTFAGAEAIESLGGPRIVVQLGKLDYTSPNEKVPITVYDLFHGTDTIAAFRNAGLSEREVTLLVGAIASMNKVVDSVDVTEKATNDNHDDEEDEVNEMGDPKVDFPSSFGAPSQIYGKRLGKMDDSIFVDEVALQKSKQATGIWADPVVGEWTTRYSKGGFFKDLPEAYSRLVRVGSTGRWQG